MKDSVREERSLATLIGFFGLVALLLASIGLYGVMAYTVVRWTNEIGIRLALGASAPEIVRLIVGDGAKLIAVGLGVGIATALGLARVVSTLFFGVSAADAARTGNPYVLYTTLSAAQVKALAVEVDALSEPLGQLAGVLSTS